MTTASRLATTNMESLPKDIMELKTAISHLPPEYCTKIAPLMTVVTESTCRRRRILSLVQEALSQLRLDMKYLMFDLEATRRERDAYRTELDQDEFEESDYDESDPDEV